MVLFEEEQRNGGDKVVIRLLRHTIAFTALAQLTLTRGMWIPFVLFAAGYVALEFALTGGG